MQNSILQLKIMHKETVSNRYTETLALDIEKLLKTCAQYNRAAEKAVINKKEKDETEFMEDVNPWIAEIDATAVQLMTFFKKFNMLETWYTRYKKPTKRQKMEKDKADEQA